MAQATGGMPATGVKLEWSTDNSDWTDLSGEGVGISFSGHDRQSGEAFTFDGDKAIVKFGKLNPTEATVRLVYQESATTDAFYRAWTEHVAAGGGAVYLRHSPKGGDTTGEYQFTSAAGKLTAILPPDTEAGPGDPLTVGFTHKCAGWTRSTVT